MGGAWRHPAAWLVGLGVVGLLVARGDQEFGYLLFTDRDLTRALRWRELWPVCGAELSAGGEVRVPGPALPLLMWAGSWLGEGAVGPFRLALGMAAVGVAWLYAAVARWRGPWTGAAVAGAWALSPVQAAMLADLWNPSFLPLPAVVAAVGTVGALRGERGALAVWAAGVAVGSQLHLSAALLGVAQAVVIAARARPSSWRPAVAVMAALYAPFLVAEVAGGLPTLRAWRAREASGGGVPADLVGRVAEMGAALADGVGDGSATGCAWAALVLTAAAIARGWRAPEGGAAAAAALVLAAYALGVFYKVEARYLAALGPALAVGLAPSPRLAGCALAAWVAASPALWRFSPDVDRASYRTVLRTVQELRRHTGWTLREVVASTAWRRREGDGPAHGRAWPTLDHLLWAAGQEFPGSGDGPCALLMPVSEAPLDLVDLERMTLARTHLDAMTGPVDLGTGWALVTYQPTVGRCPTTMSQRYLDTGVEAELRAAGPGPVAALRPGLWMVELEPGRAGPVYRVGVELAGDEVTLHSNQLRGYADSGGWYGWRALLRPRIVLTRGRERVEVALSEDLVGQAWEAAPVRARLPVDPRGWTATLVAEDVRVPEGEVEPVVRRSVEEALGVVEAAGAGRKTGEGSR